MIFKRVILGIFLAIVAGLSILAISYIDERLRAKNKRTKKEAYKKENQIDVAENTEIEE